MTVTRSSLITTPFVTVKDVDGYPWLRLRVTYGWELMEGNKNPYFTLTGEGWEVNGPEGRRRGEPNVCGSMQSIILPAFPGLALMAQAAGNDAVTGEPLHAFANSRYWYESAAEGWEGHMPASYKRLDAAGRAAAYLGCSPVLFDGAEAKSVFAERVDSLRPAWALLAQAVVSTYGLADPSEHLSEEG